VVVSPHSSASKRSGKLEIYGKKVLTIRNKPLKLRIRN
jgi:hypothetical protein